MIQYTNRDYKGIPKKYWKYQTFCWYIHDVILSIFHDCIEDDKLITRIDFENILQAKESKKTKDIIGWLYNNGKSEEANIILGKRIFHAILGDMMNFIYESLNTIEKGKITVSLALLRKPIRDNLLYLEWLLSNSDEFIRLVYDADIDKYAIEYVDILKKQKIIEEAINLLDNNDFFDLMDGKVYYDLRYNKEAGNSLQKVWDKANHLVTTRKHNRSQEFNFVFIDEQNHKEFIDYYYKQVPHLLFYTYNIVIKLYEKFIRKPEETTKSYNNFLIVFKLADLKGTIKLKEYFNNDTRDLLQFICEDCKKIVPIMLNSKQFNGFRYGVGFECPVCSNFIPTARYVFFENYKNNDI
jgi:hypothetical protein